MSICGQNGEHVPKRPLFLLAKLRGNAIKFWFMLTTGAAEYFVNFAARYCGCSFWFPDILCNQRALNFRTSTAFCFVYISTGLRNWGRSLFYGQISLSYQVGSINDIHPLAENIFTYVSNNSISYDRSKLLKCKKKIYIVKIIFLDHNKIFFVILTYKNMIL